MALVGGGAGAREGCRLQQAARSVLGRQPHSCGCPLPTPAAWVYPKTKAVWHEAVFPQAPNPGFPRLASPPHQHLDNPQRKGSCLASVKKKKEKKTKKVFMLAARGGGVGSKQGRQEGCRVLPAGSQLRFPAGCA